jgi:hypothetical protein
MQEILVNLGSSAWWFSTIVIALAVNIVSSYMKAPLDKGMSKVSLAWRDRSMRSRKEFSDAVTKLAGSPEHLAIEVENEFRFRIQSITMAVWTTIPVLLIGLLGRKTAVPIDPPTFPSNLTFFGALALASMLISIAFHTSAMKCRAKVIAAREVRKLA